MLKNKPSGIAHVAIPTDDPEATKVFYENLGFRPIYDEPRVTHRLFCSL